MESGLRTGAELRDLAERSGLKVEALQGAICYLACGLAARLLAPADHSPGRWTTSAATFLAFTALIIFWCIHPSTSRVGARGNATPLNAATGLIPLEGQGG